MPGRVMCIFCVFASLVHMFPFSGSRKRFRILRFSLQNGGRIIALAIPKLADAASARRVDRAIPGQMSPPTRQASGR